MQYSTQKLPEVLMWSVYLILDTSLESKQKWDMRSVCISGNHFKAINMVQVNRNCNTWPKITRGKSNRAFLTWRSYLSYSFRKRYVSKLCYFSLLLPLAPRPSYIETLDGYLMTPKTYSVPLHSLNIKR